MRFFDLKKTKAEGEGRPMSIAIHLRGGEVVGFKGDPDEWRAAFSKALRQRCGVEVTDLDHGGRLGVNPRNVLYWKALLPASGDD